MRLESKAAALTGPQFHARPQYATAPIQCTFLRVSFLRATGKPTGKPRFWGIPPLAEAEPRQSRSLCVRRQSASNASNASKAGRQLRGERVSHHFGREAKGQVCPFYGGRFRFLRTPKLDIRASKSQGCTQHHLGAERGSIADLIDQNPGVRNPPPEKPKHG